jgi:hypothetical protein
VVSFCPLIDDLTAQGAYALGSDLVLLLH